jgi:hypothetical protein
VEPGTNQNTSMRQTPSPASVLRRIASHLLPVEKIKPKHRFVKAIYMPRKNRVFSTTFESSRHLIVFNLGTLFTTADIQK